MGAQEGAAEVVEAMNPFRGRSTLPSPQAGSVAAPSPTIRFVGLGADASGEALVTLDELIDVSGEVGAHVIQADAIAGMGRNSGRLWLGRYGSGAIPGGRYPRAGIELLEGYAQTYGGRTGAINLSEVPRAEWFANIQPLIDEADEVMFHVSTGVGVVDEARGIQYLTNEELMYILNNPQISSKTTFFYLPPFD
jgi:hypothetical protein